MKSQTVDSITLGPTDNLQADVRFFSLVTGQILQQERHIFILLKILEDLLYRIKQMAKNIVQGVKFCNCVSNPYNGDRFTGVETTNTNTNTELTTNPNEYEMLVESKDNS